MPLEFLKRKGNADAATAAPTASAAPSGMMPEEVVAQDHQLKLYYAGKSSEGVRLKAGPAAIAELPTMLVGLARSEIEVVEPLPIEFSQATPTIVSPSEAMQWLNAHHVHSPITRHALVVLESIDAVDLAFDTFVCALLDGEVDTAGYPEYNAIVGGVAAHWDEATGDMICRAVVGWGGKGVRGDTDRIGAKLLGGHPEQHPRQPVRARADADRAARAGRRSRRSRVCPLRLRVGARAGLLLPEVRHAPAARLRLRPPDARSTTTTAPPAVGGSRSSTASTPNRPPSARCAAAGPIRKAISAPTIHYKGSGWAKKERSATASPSTVEGDGRRRLAARAGPATQRGPAVTPAAESSSSSTRPKKATTEAATAGTTD